MVNTCHWNVQLRIALSFCQSNLSVKFLIEKYLSIFWGEFRKFIELNLKLSYVFLIPKKRFIKVNVKRLTCFIVTCSWQHELAMKWKGHLLEVIKDSCKHLKW